MPASQAEKDAYKLMRRGTRACRECRRRKIRCIYANDDNSDVCQECTAHDRECVKQGVVRDSSRTIQSAGSVNVQVTRLESAIQKLARETGRINDDDGDSGDGLFVQDQSITTGDDGDFAVMQHDYQKRSPIYSLFDNDLLHQKGVLEAYATEFPSQIKFPNSNLSDKEKLLSTITNIPDIFKILHFASDWWIAWREQHFALRKAAGTSTLSDFVQVKLNDENPVAVALGLMAIAMALGQIRPGIDDLNFNLPVPANHIMNYTLAAVDQIICDSKKYQSSPDIILVFMMRGKHHTENNQLRKAWLRIRQGIRCAQRIGFGTASPLKPALSDVEAEQQRFIASIFEIDHLISMVLGFPYAKDPAFTDVRAFSVLLSTSITDESLKMRALRRIIAVAAGHINDRNASIITCDQFAQMTQGTLEVAANAMPPGWWDLLAQPFSGLAAHRYESIMVQLWYWTVQAYLHLPYLIKPSDVEPAASNRQLCLDGTRNLLRAFHYLRTEPAMSVYMCNCDDFQALLGACILLVGVLQNASVSPDTDSSAAALSASIDADLALIEDVKDIFRYRMHTQGGGISKQGLAVLEELTCFLYESEDTEAIVTPTDDRPDLGININKSQKTIMLPYFGTIKVELTKKLPKRRLTSMGSVMQQQRNTMPTPPRSLDGTISDNSPPTQFLNNDFSPSSAIQYSFEAGMFHGAAGHDLSPIFTAGDPYTMMSTSSSLQTPPQQQQPQQQAQILSEVPLQMDSIAWDQWGNYMFDRELEQDWNPGLQWSDGLFVG